MLIQSNDVVSKSVFFQRTFVEAIWLWLWLCVRVRVFTCRKKIIDTAKHMTNRATERGKNKYKNNQTIDEIKRMHIQPHRKADTSRRRIELKIPAASSISDIQSWQTQSCLRSDLCIPCNQREIERIDKIQRTQGEQNEKPPCTKRSEVKRSEVK